jgi:hypothetical protein
MTQIVGQRLKHARFTRRDRLGLKVAENPGERNGDDRIAGSGDWPEVQGRAASLEIGEKEVSARQGPASYWMVVFH